MPRGELAAELLRWGISPRKVLLMYMFWKLSFGLSFGVLCSVEIESISDALQSLVGSSYERSERIVCELAFRGRWDRGISIHIPLESQPTLKLPGGGSRALLGQ